MKKIFVILIAVAFCFGAISCKKNCVCTTVTQIPWQEPTTTTETLFDQLSTKDCEARNTATAFTKVTCVSE